jgi:DNA polymerase-1
MCKDGDECFIATGDRDSFQLIRDNVTVLLPHTKMGTTTTETYTPARIMDEYGVTPLQMIDIKALQGDASDCIPGVAGVGQKTAGDLIQKFGTIKNIYDNIDTLEIKENLKNKLLNDKEKLHKCGKEGYKNCQKYLIANVKKEWLKLLSNNK